MKPLIYLPFINGLLFNEGESPVDIIDRLKGELLDLNEQTQNIQARADAEKRKLTEDEEKEMKNLFDKFEEVEEEIDRREKMVAQVDALAKSYGRKTEPENSAKKDDDKRKVPARAVDPNDRGKWGFRNFGEFAAAVKMGSSRSGSMDPRLIANAPTTYSQEGVGEDGGFLVPPDFRTEIMKKIEGVDSLLSRTDMQTTSRNSMTFPKDEIAPWSSSSGVRAYWQDEAAQMNQTKPVFNEEQIRLNKLTCLVPVTEEQLEDAPAMGSYLNSKVPQVFDYKLQNALINGTGAGQFTGILTSSALVTQAKDTSTSPIQPADTIRYRNIVDMWNRMYAPCRSRAVWLINQDVEPQLDLMQFSPGSTVPIPVYMPAGGASATPYATLKGRPVIPVESCPALGDVGDIILADLSQYMTLMKTGGIRQDVSIHLFFDYDVTAFRFVFRIGGKPWWNSPITLPNSTLTRSCFVALAERA